MCSYCTGRPNSKKFRILHGLLLDQLHFMPKRILEAQLYLQLHQYPNLCFLSNSLGTQVLQFLQAHMGGVSDASARADFSQRVQLYV